MITIWKTPIVATVEQVLKDLKLQLYGAGLLKEIKNTGSDLMCTCPFHANGKEHNPSCGVLLQQKVTKDKTYEAGTVHCYTCGYTADLPQFVADLLGLSTYHDFTTSWCMKINLYEVFCGIEYRELPDYEPDPDEVKITRWQRIKKIIQLIKKHHLDKEISEFKSWVESQKAEAESLRAKYKAGSDGYKSLTKRITLYNRAIREAEK